MYKIIINCIIKNIVKTINSRKPIKNKIIKINSKIIIIEEISIKKIKNAK
jgi:hypothetical protein